MKKALWLVSGLGVGAGLMYLFDPAYGKRRRWQARSRMRVARQQMGNALDETAQTVRHWRQRAAVGVPSWPVPRLGTPRFLPASQAWRARQQRRDKGLLLLGCLGLGTVVLAMFGAGSSSRQAVADVAVQTVRDAYDWTCGMVTGVASWLQQEDGSHHAPVTSGHAD